MNEILTQAKAQWAAAATTCASELAEAETRLDRVKAEAKRNSEELAKATAKAVAAIQRDAGRPDAYPVDNFHFGPDPDSTEEQPAEPARPQQAPTPAPAARRRPVGAPDDEESEGPRIFREDSW